jgi:hypothetical protein
MSSVFDRSPNIGLPGWRRSQGSTRNWPRWIPGAAFLAPSRLFKIKSFLQ